MGYRIIKYTKTESILPPGYTQLEYIESSGTQYIATGVSTTNQQISVSTEMASNYVSNYTKALGYSTNTSGPPFSLWTTNNNYAGYGTSTIPTSTISQFNTIIMNNNSVTISDFYIFDVNPTVTGYVRTTGKIKIVTISVDSVVVRKLYPAKDSNDVVGMYDTINDVFYTNQGTGDFIAGPEGGSIVTKQSLLGVSARPQEIPVRYTQHEYIETTNSTINLYLNTGIYLTNKSRIECKVMGYGSDGFFYGGRQSYGNSAMAAFGGWIPFGSDAGSTAVASFPSGTLRTVSHSQDGFYLDGTKVYDYATQTFTCPVTCSLFNCTQGTEGSFYRPNNTLVRFYYFKIYEDDVLVFDGYPAKDPITDAEGMYDKISKRLITSPNAHLGSYNFGPSLSGGSGICCIKTQEES